MKSARIAGWLSWLVPFALYCASLDRAIGYWDTGEMQVVPWILGIAHPTGFPAFTLLGWLFAHVVIVGSVAARLALFCALATSLAAWFVARIVDELTGAPWIAMGSAWLFAFGEVVWRRGTRAEVHDVAAAFAVATIFYAVAWYKRGDARALIAAAAAWGLGIATHPLVALLMPGLAVLAFARVRTLRLKTSAIALAALCAGLALYAYLPVRSSIVVAGHLDPTARIGLPPGQSFWDTDDPRTRRGFVALVSGEQFGAGSALRAMFTAAPYREHAQGLRMLFYDDVSVVGMLLLAVGVVFELRRDLPLGASLLLAALLPTAYAFAYRAVIDPARYDLVAIAMVCVFAGLGAWHAQHEIRELRRWPEVVLLALAVALVAKNRGMFAQFNYNGADAAVAKVRAEAPGGASPSIVVAVWTYATPLAYAAYVQHSLPGRIVVAGWLSDVAAFVPRWSKRHRVYVVGTVFGSVNGYHTERIAVAPPIYRLVKNSR